MTTLALAVWLHIQACEAVQNKLERQLHALTAGKPTKAARASVERICVPETRTEKFKSQASVGLTRDNA